MWDWRKQTTKQKTQKTWRHKAALLLWRQSRLLWPSAISTTYGKACRLIFSQWNMPFLFVCNSKRFSCGVFCLGLTSLKLSVEGSEALWEMQNELIVRNKGPFSSVYHPDDISHLVLKNHFPLTYLLVCFLLWLISAWLLCSVQAGKKRRAHLIFTIIENLEQWWTFPEWPAY